MAISLWKKNYVVRRFGALTNVGGYMATTHTDSMALLDIQTMSNTQKTDSDGDVSVQRIKAFGDLDLKPSRQSSKGDLVWFQGKWFECIASRKSENTLIAHWTYEFIECANQDSPPTGGAV